MIRGTTTRVLEKDGDKLGVEGKRVEVLGGDGSEGFNDGGLDFVFSAHKGKKMASKCCTRGKQASKK